MEVDEIQTQQRGTSREGSSNGGDYSTSLLLPGESDVEKVNRISGWQHSSRIIRVSGGKDRHSKVWASRGLRDRRVRLSVATAIQFYDLQDRLGFDQPSKAVEWLINAAAESIADLPSLNGHFPRHDRRGDKNQAMRDDEEKENGRNSKRIHGDLSKAAGGSTSETSKSSGMSLSCGGARLKVR